MLKLESGESQAFKRLLYLAISLLPQVRDHLEFVVVSQEVPGFSWMCIISGTATFKGIV